MTIAVSLTSERNRQVVRDYFAGSPLTVLHRRYRLSTQRLHQIIQAFRADAGLILPGLVLTPCAGVDGEPCGRLIATGSSVVPVYCHVCTQALTFKQGATDAAEG
jgi:hypothetical protein